MLIYLLILILSVFLPSLCEGGIKCYSTGRFSKYSLWNFNMEESESLVFNAALYIDVTEYSTKYIYFKVILYEGEYKSDYMFYHFDEKYIRDPTLNFTVTYDDSNSNIRYYKILNQKDSYKYLYILLPKFYGTSIGVENYYKFSIFEIIGIIFGVLVIIVFGIILGCYCYKKRKKLKPSEKDDVSCEVCEAAPINYPIPPTPTTPYYK